MRFLICLLPIMVLNVVAVGADANGPGTANASASKPASNDLPVVAIKEFKNGANAPDGLFRSLRARITGDILNTRKFTLVERERMDTAVSEQKLAESGITNAKGTSESGQLKAAQFVVYGTVLSLGLDSNAAQVGDMTAAKLTAKVEVQLRFTDAERGEILATKTITAIKSQARMASGDNRVDGNVGEQVVQDAIRESSKKIVEALMDLAYPAKIIAVDSEVAKVNLTKEQTELGAIYEVYALGADLIDPDTGKSLGKDEKLVGELEVLRVLPRFVMMKARGQTRLAALKPGMVVRRMDPEILKQRADQEKASKMEAVKSRF